MIGFNGATAAELFRRKVIPTLEDSQRGIERHILPSTSGANARMTFTEKVKKWSVLFPRPDARSK